MEQLTLENKVNNTLKWLANKIGCIQVYHLDENVDYTTVTNDKAIQDVASSPAEAEGAEKK